MEVADNRYCFICGESNPLGLKAAIAIDRAARSARLTTTVPAEFQGWEGMVHGGIISALLDEVCAYAGMTVSGKVVTGELKTRFRKPVPVARAVTAAARVVEEARRTLLVEAELTLDGELLASAEAKMVMVKG